MSPPLKIVQYLPLLRLAEGGPVRVVLDLAAGLAERGHAVAVVAWDGADAPPAWSEGGEGLPRLELIPPPRLPGGLLSRAALRRVRELVREADVLHLHGMWTPSSLQAAGVARRLGVPYVITPHGMLDDWSMAQRGPKKRLYLRLAGRRWLAGAAAIHCTARAELEQARKYLPAGRGVVVPCLHDLRPYDELPGPERARERFPALRTGRPALLFLSRIHPQKRPEALIEAGAELARAGRDCEVLIAGPGEPGYLESLRALARRVGLADRVHLLGMIAGADKYSLYQAADLFVLPTSQESFGLVFFESLLCGTPVVTTPQIDTRRELEASGGVKITPAEHRQLAAAIAGLLDDPGALARMGRDGRERMRDFLNPRRVLDEYEAMYTEQGRSNAVTQ